MNVMPNLTADEYERLRDDIRQRGVLDAVIYDEDGRVLDGHNRLAIAAELHLDDVPRQTIDLGDATDAERDAVAATLNVNRRQLRPEEQRELAIQFRLNGVPSRDTAQLVAGSDRSVRAWSSRAVGEQRKQKVAEAVALIDNGQSVNAAAAAVGLPQPTLHRAIHSGSSAALDNRTTNEDDMKVRLVRQMERPAPLRKARPIPTWSRYVTAWLRNGARPEDRDFLKRLDRELHAALQQNGIECSLGEKSA